MIKFLDKNFILAFLAQSSFAFVFHALMPTLPIYLSRLGSTKVEIGILIGSLAVAGLILRPFVGRLLLKIPEKRFMMAGALLFALTSFSFIFVPPFWPFLLVRIFQGFGFAFFHTSSFTLIVNRSAKEHLGRSLSYFYLAINISAAIAPFFGMFIINHLNFNSLFLICVGLSICSLFISYNIKTEKPIYPTQLPEEKTLFNRKAIPSSIMFFLTNMTWGAVTSFFPIYAIQNGISNPGIFFTVYAIVLIIVRATGGKLLDLYNKESIISPCIILYIIAMCLLAISKTLPMFIMIAILWGIGNSFLIPALMAYSVEKAGSSSGTVMGTITAAMDLGVGLGPVIMGIILHKTNYPVMFLSLGLTGALNLIYFFSYVKKK